MKNVVTTGSLVALAAAGLFACASNNGAPKSQPSSQSSSGSSASAEMVKCAGVNECKGHGACGGQGHDCAGKNECKGQGWIETTAAACNEGGGTII